MPADTQQPWLNALLAMLEEHREAIEFDIGHFTWREYEPHEEIILLPESGGAFRCYLVTTGSPEPVILYDDYFPTNEEREFHK